MSILGDNKRIARLLPYADITIIICSFTFLYNSCSARVELDHFQFPMSCQFSLILNIITWTILANYFDVYNINKHVLLSDDIWNIVRTASGAIAVSMSVLIMSSSPSMASFELSLEGEIPFLDLETLLMLWIFQVIPLLLLRFTVQNTLKFVHSRGYQYRQILIVGCNQRSLKLAREIDETARLGYRILGFVDAPGGMAQEIKDQHFQIIGDLSHIENIIRNQIVDEILVVLPVKSFYSEIEKIIRLSEAVGVEVKLPTDLFDLNNSKSIITKYLGFPCVNLYSSPKMSLQLAIKRLIDITVSLFLLVLLAPLLPIVSILIKLNSKGPVFFKQQRVGYNGRLFTCLKFRTMIENADALKKDLLALNEMDGPVFKIKNDMRVTGVGKIFRKTSIDELPQLINVLKGDMSLVGPRPPVPNEVRQYDLNYRRRLSMRPGITCLWQVSGRNRISFKEWMELDQAYIDHWSLWLDLKLLLKTIPAVLKGDGAA